MVLANCGSGAGGEEAARVQAIRAAFAPLGVVPDVRCVAGPDITAVASRLRSEAEGNRPVRGRGSPLVVVAAGGDGSVSGVAAALAGSPIPMGILPMGTLNHFAKDAGLALDLAEAASDIVAGATRRVDVASVNGHTFVNNSSIGLYPNAVDERERRPRRWASKRVAMVGAALRVLQRMPRHHVRLTLDGEPAVRTTSFVFVGNNTYETGFGSLGKRSRLDGGNLSVYFARRPDRRTVLALAARSLVGRLDQATQLETRQVHRVTVEMRRPAVDVSLDGEVVRLRSPLRYEVQPGALVLLGPSVRTAQA